MDGLLDGRDPTLIGLEFEAEDFAGCNDDEIGYASPDSEPDEARSLRLVALATIRRVKIHDATAYARLEVLDDCTVDLILGQRLLPPAKGRG